MKEQDKIKACCEKCLQETSNFAFNCINLTCSCHKSKREVIAFCHECGAEFTTWLSDSKDCPECEAPICFKELHNHPAPIQEEEVRLGGSSLTHLPDAPPPSIDSWEKSISQIFYHIIAFTEDEGEYQPTEEQARQEVKKIINDLCSSAIKEERDLLKAKIRQMKIKGKQGRKEFTLKSK